MVTAQKQTITVVINFGYAWIESAKKLELAEEIKLTVEAVYPSDYYDVRVEFNGVQPMPIPGCFI